MSVKHKIIRDKDSIHIEFNIDPKYVKNFMKKNFLDNKNNEFPKFNDLSLVNFDLTNLT